MSKKVKVTYTIEEDLKFEIMQNALKNKMRVSEYVTYLFKKTLDKKNN